MLILFLSLVACKGFDVDAYEQGAYQPSKALEVRYHVCSNQSNLIYLGGALFFSYIGRKLFESVKKRRQAKSKLA
jgi:hypothetical protein